VFYTDVAKVNQDVAYVARVVHVCCKLSVPNVSSVFSRRMLQVCLFRCCICFTPMLQVFYRDVAYVLQYFFKYFRYIFRVFHLPSDVWCVTPGFKNKTRYTPYISPGS
jgi:hypothetical protein